MQDADDKLIAYARNEGLVTPAQIDAATSIQRGAAARGRAMTLADALVSQGALTQAVRENIEKLLAERQLAFARLGRYRLLRKLGEGGMGTVYLAEEPLAAREVAIKVLPPRMTGDPDALARFRREAKALGKLSHPNVITLFFVGEDAGHHFVVMEYARGETLASILDRGALAWERALDLVTQSARGLAHAHERGVVHRDIKPGNIFVTEGGVAKILDLGLSTFGAAAGKSFVTETGAVMGTPHYMSPEQARGDKAVDHRADIYSLGATFHHLVAGRPPFDGTALAAVLLKHQAAPPPDPRERNPEVPGRIVEIIGRMMAKGPDDRHRNCAELLADLESAAKAGPPARVRLDAAQATAQPQGVTPAKKPKSWKFPMMAAAGVVVFAIVSGLSVYFSGNPSRKVENPGVNAASPRESVPVPRPRESPTSPPDADAIDLLSVIDVGRDARSGNWEYQDGALRCGGKAESKLDLPFEPPDEYDFQVTFALERDGVYDLTLVLSKGDRSFAWKLAGWDRPVVAGFESVSGTQVWMKENPTRAVVLAIAPGKPHAMVVKVRKNTLSGYLDGVLVSSWKTDYSDLALHESMRVGDGKRIGLFVGKDSVAVRFSAISVREETGKGRVLAKPVARKGK